MMSSNAGEPKYIGNRDRLLEIETTYDYNRLNRAQEKGLDCLIIPIVKNPELELSSLLLKNIKTKEFKSVQSRAVITQYGRGVLEYPEDEWQLVQEVFGYGRNRDQSQNWGAYIIPEVLEIDQTVYIPDLIEDIVATGFWYTVWPAGDAIATWDGIKLEIDKQQYLRFQMIG